jgi:hypothetical protein
MKTLLSLNGLPGVSSFDLEIEKDSERKRNDFKSWEESDFWMIKLSKLWKSPGFRIFPESDEFRLVLWMKVGWELEKFHFPEEFWDLKSSFGVVHQGKFDFFLSEVSLGLEVGKQSLMVSKSMSWQKKFLFLGWFLKNFLESFEGFWNEIIEIQKDVLRLF